MVLKIVLLHKPLHFESLLALFVALLLTFPLLAKGNGIKLLEEKKIPKGSVVVYERGDGSRFTMTFFGKTKLGYKNVWRDGSSGQGPIFRTVYNDKNGRRIREIQNGMTLLYEPHSCARVMGKCEYKVTHLATGKERFFQTITRRLDNGDYEARIIRGGLERSRTRFRISKYFGLGASWIFKQNGQPVQKGRLIEVRR